MAEWQGRRASLVLVSVSGFLVLWQPPHSAPRGGRGGQEASRRPDSRTCPTSPRLHPTHQGTSEDRPGRREERRAARKRLHFALTQRATASPRRAPRIRVSYFPIQVAHPSMSAPPSLVSPAPGLPTSPSAGASSFSAKVADPSDPSTPPHPSYPGNCWGTGQGVTGFQITQSRMNHMIQAALALGPPAPGPQRSCPQRPHLLLAPPSFPSELVQTCTSHTISPSPPPSVGLVPDPVQGTEVIRHDPLCFPLPACCGAPTSFPSGPKGEVPPPPVCISSLFLCPGPRPAFGVWAAQLNTSE